MPAQEAPLGPNALQAEAGKLCDEAQLLQRFLARLRDANGARLTDKQASAVYEALNLDEFRHDVVFALVANANTAIRRAGLEDVIPCETYEARS